MLESVLAKLTHPAGSLFFDVRTAVLMLEHGVRQIYTTDSDFLQVPGIRVVNPPAGAAGAEQRVGFGGFPDQAHPLAASLPGEVGIVPIVVGLGVAIGPVGFCAGFEAPQSGSML